MKIPVEWLSEYLNFSKPSKDLANDFTLLGLLLDKPIINYKNQNFETAVLDLEHRMDRSDWLSVLGCARDISAFNNSQLKYPALYDKPLEKVDSKDKISIKVDCPNIVNRFTTLVVKNVKVQKSPEWLANRLESYGIPSINNIVDITNYVMVEYGQPMHAQDISKMRAKEIHIRNAHKNEKIKTLLGEEITLDESMFVLTQAGTPTVIGGIVGGEETGVDFNTKDIVLDAGNYDQVNVRQTSRKLKIQNETVLRYDKFLHPMLTQIALDRAAYLIQELAGGEIYINDDYISPNTSLETTKMTLTKARLDLLSGQNFDFGLASQILTNLEYKILQQTPHELQVEVPFFRTDVQVEDDLVADVLRIYGYNKIEPAKLNMAPPQEITPTTLRTEEKIRDIATKIGLNEYITSPFVAESTKENEIKLINTVNQGMNALRTQIYQTLQPNIETYVKNKIKINGIFEIGTVFFDLNGNLKEARHFEVVTYPQENTIKTAQKTKDILATFLNEFGLNYSVKSQNGISKILCHEIQIGQIGIDFFTLYIKDLSSLDTQNLSILESFPNYKTRDITLNANNDLVGEAIYYIKNFESVRHTLVNDHYIDSNNNKSINVTLYFDTQADPEIELQNILKQIKQNFDVELKN